MKFGGRVFSGCKNLTIDQFEAGGKKLEDRVFSEVRINTLQISGTLEAYSMYGGCFQGADVGKVEISESLEEISDYTFRSCEWLKAIELPDSILKIGNSAFSNCTNLKTITISSVVYKIRKKCFFRLWQINYHHSFWKCSRSLCHQKQHSSETFVILTL